MPTKYACACAVCTVMVQVAPGQGWRRPSSRDPVSGRDGAAAGNAGSCCRAAVDLPSTPTADVVKDPGTHALGGPSAQPHSEGGSAVLSGILGGEMSRMRQR